MCVWALQTQLSLKVFCSTITASLRPTYAGSASLSTQAMSNRLGVCRTWCRTLCAYLRRRGSRRLHVSGASSLALHN